MFDIRKYNYFTWIDGLRRLNFTPKSCGNNILEIGAGNGTFLRCLVSAGYGISASGIDIREPTNTDVPLGRSARLRLIQADIVNAPIRIDVAPLDTVFFMNMLYVVPLTEVEKFLRTTPFRNLVVSYPLEPALDLFEKRHPGINLRGNSFDTFRENVGCVENAELMVTRSHYLCNPLRCGVGSLHPSLARLSDKGGSEPFYKLVWLTRQSDAADPTQ